MTQDSTLTAAIDGLILHVQGYLRRLEEAKKLVASDPNTARALVLKVVTDMKRDAQDSAG
jgi:hypothetical protein